MNSLLYISIGWLTGSLGWLITFFILKNKYMIKVEIINIIIGIFGIIISKIF